jgi:hypothetical protein
VIDFTSMPDNLEDEQTISYLMDTAKQGGFETRWSAINEIGYDSRNHVFVSGPRLFHRSEPIVSCFKLYPLECMMREAFGQQMVDAPTFWIEPPWKALLSNKAILALAWEKHATRTCCPAISMRRAFPAITSASRSSAAKAPTCKSCAEARSWQRPGVNTGTTVTCTKPWPISRVLTGTGLS